MMAITWKREAQSVSPSALYCIIPVWEEGKPSPQTKQLQSPFKIVTHLLINELVDQLTLRGEVFQTFKLLIGIPEQTITLTLLSGYVSSLPPPYKI